MHFFKIFAFLFSLCISVFSVAETVLTDEDRAIKEMAEKIRKESSQYEVPKNIHQDEANLAAKKMLHELQNRHTDITGVSPDRDVISSSTLIFVSYSLGEEELTNILSYSAEIPDAMVILRGIVDEEDFAGSILKVQKLAARQNPVANLVIDPTLFRDYSISVVPTIIELDKTDRSELGRVSGLAENGWLTRKIKSGARGDFGVKGDVKEILERDLIEVMQDKVAKIDWAQKKRESIERFWTKQYFIDLPFSTANRTRHIDPTVLITSDIKDAEGKTVVPAGQKINPLDQVPFTQAVIVFDATSKKQITIVENKLQQLTSKYSKITLISTRFENDKGWEFYKSVTDQFSKPVYKLTPEIVDRFRLERVPSVITSTGKVFVVEEITSPEENNNG